MLSNDPGRHFSCVGSGAPRKELDVKSPVWERCALSNPTVTTLKPITSALRRLAEATKVMHLTPWFALFGAIATPTNLLLGNHITLGFWVATMALPGLTLDLSRMLNGGKAWERKEAWFTKRTVAALVIVVAIAAPLEAVLDHLGGYRSTNALVNTDWSQLSDALALSVALPVARQFLHWSKPKKGSATLLMEGDSIP